MYHLEIEAIDSPEPFISYVYAGFAWAYFFNMFPDNVPKYAFGCNTDRRGATQIQTLQQNRRLRDPIPMEDLPDRPKIRETLKVNCFV